MYYLINASIAAIIMNINPIPAFTPNINNKKVVIKRIIPPIFA